MESVTYIISLDAIDWNLLYSSYKTRHNITPLWSVNSKNVNLCEFQIVNQTSSTNQLCVKEDPRRLHKEMENIMCHICNTNVPKQYLREHKKSLKHEINMKIVNAALMRITKQMNTEYNNEEIEANESIYFCSYCIAVVNVKEETNHKESHDHKNSVFLDKRLSEFLNLYSNNIDQIETDLNIVNKESNVNKNSKHEKVENATTDNLDLINNFNDIIDEESNVNNNSKQEKVENATRDNLDLINNFNDIVDEESNVNNNSKYEKVENATTDNLDLKNNFNDIVDKESNVNNISKQEKVENAARDNLDLINNCNDIVDEESNVNNNAIQENIVDATTDSLDLINYFNTLRDEYKISTNVKVIDKRWLGIAIDGSKVKVAANSFHGFRGNPIVNTSVWCLICQEVVRSRDEDRWAHMMEAKHVHHIIKPMQDVHCIREISHPSVFFGHHCVLCNIIISHYNEHKTYDRLHSELFKVTLNHDVANSVNNSTASAESVRRVSTDKTNNTEITKTKPLGSVKSKYNHLFKIDTDKRVCIVCDKILNQTDSFETHVNLDYHIKKYNELLAINNIKELFKDKLLCGNCNEIVLFDNVLSHVSDSYHKQYSNNLTCCYELCIRCMCCIWN